MHPDILLDQLTSRQLSEWMAYDVLDPIGAQRSDYHTAYLSMVVTNIARKLYGKKNVEFAGIDEFMPDWDLPSELEKKSVKKQTVEEQKGILYAIASHFKNKEK